MKKLNLLSVIFALLFLSMANSFGQGTMDDSFKMRLESILNKFKNYRYSNVSVFKFKNANLKDIRAIVKRESGDEDTPEAATATNDSCVKKFPISLTNVIRSSVSKGRISPSMVKQDLIMGGYSDLPPDEDLRCVVNYFRSQTARVQKIIRNAYVVTTEPDRETNIPGTIIALIVSYDGESDYMSDHLLSPNPYDIFTYPELKQTQLDKAQFKADNLHDLVLNAFLQNGVEDLTMEARGFGTGKLIFRQKPGYTASLVQDELVVASPDVQMFKRISEGQPIDYKDKRNEVIVSPDLLSWKQYDYTYTVDEEGFADTSAFITNYNLPKWGVELKYGADDIGYPSFFSERLTLNALWQGVKMGLIFSSDALSNMSPDVYKVNRKFALSDGAIAGISGEADFALDVIPQSGIFKGSFAYIFGDATEGPIKRDKDFLLSDLYNPKDPSSMDYMIRFNAQLLYTFGVSIDKNYLLRFGLGPTVYGVEQWHNEVITDPNTNDLVTNYKNYSSESIGGVSGRIDFMSKSSVTPYGLSLMYFDEGIYTNFWLQIPLPVLNNGLSLRFDAKGFFKAFTNNPRAWENKSIFMPMVRLIFYF